MRDLVTLHNYDLYIVPHSISDNGSMWREIKLGIYLLRELR